MPKIFVHDFKFEYVKLEQRESNEDFYCGVTIYYNFSGELSNIDWDNLEYFFISVTTPFGLASYLKQTIVKGLFPAKRLLSNLLIFDTCNEDEIMNFIKHELNSIYGKTEKELVLKAIRNFDWENERNLEIFEKLYS